MIETGRFRSPVSSDPIMYPVVETIEKRRSVRTYQMRPLEANVLDSIKEYIPKLSNPFDANVKISIIHKDFGNKAEKLGTYGVIKGASTFMGLAVTPGNMALVGAGYQFEDLILYATYLGLGTVWMAATFSRDRFKSAMRIPDNYLFPAISPLGYPQEKRLMEVMMRKTLGSDKRKPWKDLFFENDFGTPLKESHADIFAIPLEMMRLAPSATNAQPWRVLKRGNIIHFYETHKEKAREDDKLIKQVDLGIGIFHFHKTLQSFGYKGEFKRMEIIDVNKPDDYHYVISFVANPQ